LAASI